MIRIDLANNTTRHIMTNFQFHTTLLLLCVSSCVYLDILPVKTESILIRPYYVYENLIKGVHDYFNNTCIILFHGSSKLIEEEGLQEMDGLLTLQTRFSKYLHIRTVIMDFHMFKNRVERTYHHIKRPLFVLLNDFKEIREQFVSVSKWITMAYPTWLLFLRDETRFEEFLSDVYIPFDCVFMVAQRDRQGSEIIQDVYRIGKEDYLRSMTFGTWNSSHGFQGPLLGLYQRRHDLHGHNIRVVAINDPPISRISRDKAGQPFGITGFFGEVIQLLQEGMNCTSIVRSCLTRIGTACRVIMRITLYSIACLFMLRRRRRRHLFVMIFTRLFTPLVALLFTLGFTLGFPLDAKLAYLLQLSGRYLPKILLLIGSRFFLEPFPLSTVTASAKSFVTTMRDYHRLFIVTPYCRASVTGIRGEKNRLIPRRLEIKDYPIRIIIISFQTNEF